MFFLHPPSNPPTPPPHWGAQPFLCPSSPEGLSPRDPNTLTTAKSRPIHGTILSPHYQSSTVQQLQHCMGCECLIMDSQLIKIFPDCFLHEHCAVCSICNTSLMPRRSSHSFSPQWTKCYTICPACNMSIQLDEFACKLKNDIVYHFRCLRCAQCNKKLKRGDRLVLSELCRTIKCAEHIYANANDEWLMAAANGRKAFSRRENAGEGIPGNQLPNAGEGIAKVGSGNQLPNAGEGIAKEEDAHQKVHGNKRRGPRTTISQKQLDILNRMFDNFPKPSKHERAKLALDSGLSMRVIQVWFQNRRSKERRLKHLCNFLRHYEGHPRHKNEEKGGEELTSA
uniref:Homeobox domain-containing protein n=1 Tax=Globodera pallida TaxID=36090 RepID=A0A183BV54_GLOPA